MRFNFKKYNNTTLGGILIHLALACSTLIILAVLYFYLYLPSITNHGESITVPNIEGMHVDELEEFLVKRNLRWEVSDSSYSAKYPSLTVLKQFPHAGAKVKENRKIFISINSINPPAALLPDLIDKSVMNAEVVLKANELKRGRIEYVPGPFNIVQAMKYQGKIVPPTTRVPKGSVIDLVVMDGGSSDVITPELTNLSWEDAKLLILGSNLNIGRITLVGDTTGNDPVVIRQNPAGNENIKVGDIVDIWIGKAGADVSNDE